MRQLRGHLRQLAGTAAGAAVLTGSALGGVPSGVGVGAAAPAGATRVAAIPGRSRAPGAPASPVDDPFYRPAAGFASTPPGTILRSRQVSVKLGLVPVTGPAFRAFQLLYRTNDATGRPVANVTTVLVPEGPPAGGGRQLLSVDDAEDSVDANCAPSYQLQSGELAENGDANLAAETMLGIIGAALRQGREVVIPDAEGPRSEYLVTGMEAQATLDSVRAAERYPAAGLHGAGTPVGLMGYSGGAHVTAAADELQPAYVPELHVVGVAAGGVPVGNEKNLVYLDGSIGAGVLMAVAIGVDRAYPFGLNSLLNARGEAFAKQVSTGCASSVFAAPYAHFSGWTRVPNAFQLPRIARIIDQNSLGHATPRAPTFFYNAIHDELVWIKPLDDLVASYCAHGAMLDYFRDPAGFEHIQGVANFAPLALAYLNNRFAGDPAPDTCGSPGNSGTALGNP